MCVKTRFPFNKQTERNVMGNRTILTRLASGEKNVRYTDIIEQQLKTTQAENKDAICVL